jgi:type VI secretion system protein ImpM
MSTHASDTGIHGKLPSHGDFITRRLSRDFVDVWDDWLQRAISTSKSELGEHWLNTYLTSPIWSFTLGAGICGDAAWAGVLMPSVDRVGRYFPLTLAVPLPAAMSPCDVLMNGTQWFEQARALALSSLEEDQFSLETFDTSVAELGCPGDAGDAASGAFVACDASGAQGWHVPLTATGGPGLAVLRLTHGLLEARTGPYSVWWSDGSELVPSCTLVKAGLPDPSAYASFLDGHFREQYWLSLPPPSMDVPRTQGDDA